MQSKNTLDMTIKFTSLQALITLVNKLPVHSQNNIGLKNGFATYLPYILSQGIVDCIKVIKPDLQERKAINYTKYISLGIGLITSAAITCSYNGINYILNFSLTLLKASATTLIIDKLNKLKTIDGVSVAILMNLIFTIPSFISGISTQPLVVGLLFITSIGVIAYGNYKLLQSTQDANIHYKDTKDKFSLSTRNTYTTALVMSQFITNLISNNPIIQGSLMFIINPLIQWFMATSTDTEELNKHIQQSNIYLNGLKHGKETEDYLKQMIRKNSIKLGVTGAVTFILSSLLIKVFAISISPIMLTIAVNSFINVNFNIKTLVKSNIKGVRGFVIQKN